MRAHLPCSVFQILAVGLTVCALSLTWEASPAAADTLYTYSNTFTDTTGDCPDPTLNISVVYDEAIPPNTPVPMGTANTLGFVSWEFSACGETCSSAPLCFTPGGTELDLVFRFATDANGDPNEWEVAWGYQRPSAPGFPVTFGTRQEPGVIEGDLYIDLQNGVQATATSVASWTVTELGGDVPVSTNWSLVFLTLTLLATASALLLRRRAQAQ